MHQIRKFFPENLDKMSGLLYHLSKAKTEYSVRAEGGDVFFVSWYQGN